MKRPATLSVDSEAFEELKVIARENEFSVSAVVNDFIKSYNRCYKESGFKNSYKVFVRTRRFDCKRKPS